MSGLEPAIIGALFSSGVGAASAAAQGNAQRRAQKRIAKESLKSSADLARKGRVASGQEVEAERQAGVASDKLAKAKGRQISNTALAQKGIKARPVKSFADISQAVLDEGTA
jgi:hypothetical protein